MTFYSFIVNAPEDLDFPEHLLSLAEGRNIFNLLVPDLKRFIEELQACGVSVIQAIKLDVDTQDTTGICPQLV